MEVSSIISSEQSATTASNSNANATMLPPSSHLATTTNTNNQILLGKDNLQSQKPKSPITILVNNDNLKLQPAENPTKAVVSNNSACGNNRVSNNESPSATNCHEPSRDPNAELEIRKIDRKEPQEHVVEKKHESNLDQDESRHVIRIIIDEILSRIDLEHMPSVASTACQSTVLSSANEPITKVALITPVVVDEDAGTKDIVTLRNLEITPPPQSIKEDETPTTTATTTPDVQYSAATTSGRKRKMERTHSETTEQSDESTGGRSKRQRKQTELFQVVSDKTPRTAKTKDVSDKSKSSRQSVGSTKKVQSRIPRFQSKPGLKCERKQEPARQETRDSGGHSTERQRDFQDVIYYEKNDYLAIRNEENTFFLCQLTENVRVHRPIVKIRWLDSPDDGKTYFMTSQFDKIPQKSIIMPVMLNKLPSSKSKSKTIFTIDEPIRETVMERLKRSLNVPTETFE